MQFGFFVENPTLPLQMPPQPRNFPTLLRKALVQIAAFASFLTTVTAQDKAPLQIQIGAGVGAGVPVAPSAASATSLASFRADAAILFSRGRHFLVGAGIGLGEWRNKTTNSATIVTPNAIDKDGEAYEHHTTLDNVTEEQRICTVDVPLHMIFRSSPLRKLSFQARAWAGVTIPFAAKFKTTGGSISTEGYYEQYNLLLYDMPENGFYTDRSSHQGNIRLRPLAAYAGAGAGASVRIGKESALGIEAFISHAFSDLKRKAEVKQFDPDCLRADGYAGAKYRSVLETSECGSVRPTQFGIGLFFRTQIGRRKRKREPLHPEARTATQNDGRKRANPASSPAVPPTEPTQGATPAPPSPSLQELIDHEGPISFELGGAKLSDEASRTVERIAQLIANGTATSVIVIGHTCDKGSDATNQRVGLMRAKAVADKLAESGVPREKLSISSAGSARPRAANDSEAHRAQNRRVEIIVK